MLPDVLYNGRPYMSGWQLTMVIGGLIAAGVVFGWWLRGVFERR